MKQYIREYDGQMAYFDGQSTFELLDDVPFINLDISQLEERFARPLAQQILLSWIWEKYVKKNSEDKKESKKKKRVLIDEAWMLSPIPRSCRLFEHNGKTCKKRNVSLCSNVTKISRLLWKNQKYKQYLHHQIQKLFLAQDKSEIQYIKKYSN